MKTWRTRSGEDVAPRRWRSPVGSSRNSPSWSTGRPMGRSGCTRAPARSNQSFGGRLAGILAASIVSGTKSSNPLCSSGESTNFRFLLMRACSPRQMARWLTGCPTACATQPLPRLSRPSPISISLPSPTSHTRPVAPAARPPHRAGSVSTCASWRIPVVVGYAAARFRGDEAGCGARHVDQRPSGIGLSARRKAIAGSAAVTAASSSTSAAPAS